MKGALELRGLSKKGTLLISATCPNDSLNNNILQQKH